MLESERRSLQLLALDVIGVTGDLLNEKRSARHLLRLAGEDSRATFRLKFAISRFSAPAITAAWPEEWKESCTDESRRGRALQILNCLGKAGATPAVLDCLAEAICGTAESASKEVLFQGLAVLRRMESRANRENVVDSLVELAERGNPWFSAAAERTLVSVGADQSRPGVSETMERPAHDGIPKTHMAATGQKRRQQGTGLAESVYSLRTGLRSKSKSSRRAAARRLAALGPSSTSGSST